MKKPLIITSVIVAGLTMSSCRVAQTAAEDTEHVTMKAGHVAGKTIRKTGHSLQHAGEKIEDHTQDR